MMHGYDFIVYVYLQLAQDGKAKAAARKSSGRGDREMKIDFVGSPLGVLDTAIASIPARLGARNRVDWKGAAALPDCPEKALPRRQLTEPIRAGARNGALRQFRGSERRDLRRFRQILGANSRKGGRFRLGELARKNTCLRSPRGSPMAEGNREQALKFMRTGRRTERMVA